MGQHPRLARPGAGHHQQRAVDVGDRLELDRVEPDGRVGPLDPVVAGRPGSGPSRVRPASTRARGLVERPAGSDASSGWGPSGRSGAGNNVMALQPYRCPVTGPGAPVRSPACDEGRRDRWSPAWPWHGSWPPCSLPPAARRRRRPPPPRPDRPCPAPRSLPAADEALAGPHHVGLPPRVPLGPDLLRGPGRVRGRADRPARRRPPGRRPGPAVRAGRARRRRRRHGRRRGRVGVPVRQPPATADRERRVGHDRHRAGHGAAPLLRRLPAGPPGHQVRAPERHLPRQRVDLAVVVRRERRGGRRRIAAGRRLALPGLHVGRVPGPSSS